MNGYCSRRRNCLDDEPEGHATHSAMASSLLDNRYLVVLRRWFQAEYDMADLKDEFEQFLDQRTGRTPIEKILRLQIIGLPILDGDP